MSSREMNRIADGLAQIAAELRSLGLILAGAPIFVRKLDIERNEKGRCAKCNGTGTLPDASYCACPTGQDLRHVEMYGK